MSEERDDHEEVEAFLAAATGHWSVERDLYWIVRSEVGGLLASSCLTGDPVNPAWIISRGVRERDLACSLHQSGSPRG
jgi:hypothetical protein